jgi:hypothetical protein
MTPEAQLETPVAFVLFRRPDRTKRVFEQIRRARPKRLFLIADGPRPGAAADQRDCEQARAVVETVDWPCEVTRDFATDNLGLTRRLPSGLDSVFAEVDRAIVLEDDCLPHETFFRFCDELLERYADDDRVMHVAGSQLLREPPAWTASYHFSRYVHIWGWATWRRAWGHFDLELRNWHELDRAEREKRLGSMFATDDERRYWRYVWDNSREIENWDAQWSYALLARDGLAANPNRNLISNVGFGTDATNALEDPFGIAARPLEGMRFPLAHPEAIARDADADAAASKLFRRREPAPPRTAPLRRRAWAAALRAGGRALDFVPERIRPKVRHRDRHSPTGPTR